MKRLMILVAMMAVVLFLPMNVEASNDLIVDQGENRVYTLTEDMTVDNLEVYSMIMLNGYTLNVNGNVVAEALVHVGDGTLNVAGNYIQKDGRLEIHSGNATINGDFRVQDMNEEGEYVTSDSNFLVGDGVLTIGGNTYIDTYHSENISVYGTIVSKGDFNIENLPGTVKLNCINMAGDDKQVLNLIEEVEVSNLIFTNPNIEVGGFINGKLGSDATEITLDDGIFETKGLDLGEYDMTIPGTVYAYGQVDLLGGTLTVNEDYVQVGGLLNVAKGIVHVKGSLRVQGIDQDGKYTCGTGGILGSPRFVQFIVEKDLIIDSSTVFTTYGKMQIAGNVSKTSAGNFGAINMILNGSSPQSITFEGIATVYTLELTQERKYYTFNPEPCWEELIQLEGIRNSGEGFKYYENGNWVADAYKYVEYDGATFLVANGVVATDMNGVAQDPLNPQDWYFLAGGQVQTQHTGLAEYDGQWFYVEDGKLDTTMNGCIQYDGELFMLAEGRIISETSGLVQDPNDGVWYYLAAGRVLAEFSGLAYYDKEWFYVTDGMLNKDFAGCVTFDGKVFRVESGAILGEGHTSENGRCTHCGKITSAHASL